jgi:hypothetical protein
MGEDPLFCPLELHDREIGDFLKMTEIRSQHRKAK